MQYANPDNFLWQYSKLLPLGISTRWQLMAKLLCGDCFTATVYLDLRTKRLCDLYVINPVCILAVTLCSADCQR